MDVGTWGYGQAGPRQLRRLLHAVMSLGSDIELPTLLGHIVATGRDLVGAAYGALGVLDPSRTALDEFITVGMDDDTRTAIGELPKGHGILGLLIERPAPLRLPDLTEHPERHGFPPHHPPMRSFLGVPLYVHGEVFGNLYFTEKVDAEVFSDIDEELAVALAAAAAVAIENHRLHERTKQLTLLAERERVGRDLHDTVIQQVFATGLALHTTARLTTEEVVRARIVDHIAQLDDVVRQLRTAIFQLDVRGPVHDSVRQQILSVASDCERALGFEPLVRFHGPIDTVTTPGVAAHVVAVLREALTNTAKHAAASSVDIGIDATGGTIALTVTDDGVGIPARPRRGQGLANIRDRARALHGTAELTPVVPHGTHLRWVVPLSAVDEPLPGEPG